MSLGRWPHVTHRSDEELDPAHRTTNLAVAANSTHDTVEMLDIVADASPDHVVVMLGPDPVRRCVLPNLLDQGRRSTG